MSEVNERDFALKLKDLRRKHKLTQEELAEKLFLSRQAITRWETGTGLPDLGNLVTIAEFFGVSLDELLSKEDLSPSEPGPKWESRIQHDLSEKKRFDLALGQAAKVLLQGHRGEKLKVLLQSETIPDLEKLFKVKVDDIKSHIDIKIEYVKELARKAIKEGLEIKIQVPFDYTDLIEMTVNATVLELKNLKKIDFELDGKVSRIILKEAIGCFSLNCNQEMKVECTDGFGKIEFNQINSHSEIHIPADLPIKTIVKGPGNKILFQEDGQKVNGFSEKTATNTIELNGIKSQLIINRKGTHG